MLPNLPQSNSVEDLLYVDGCVLAINKSPERVVSACAVADGSISDRFSLHGRVIAAAPYLQSTTLFDRRTQNGEIVFFNPRPEGDENLRYTIFNHSFQVGGPAWVRARRFGEHVYFYGRAENQNVGIQRFLISGQLDVNFGEQGTVILRGGEWFSHHVSELIEQKNGCIVAIGSGNEAPVVRLLPDGSPDNNFGDLGYLQFRAARRTVGKTLVAVGENLFCSGDEYDGNSIYNCFAAMLDRTGRPSEEFGFDGSISIVTGSQDEYLDIHCDGSKATILFQHDRQAAIRHRLGLARIHLTNI